MSSAPRPGACDGGTRYDAHPFEARDGDREHCVTCGQHRRQILHHPTRVRAAQALRAAARREDGGAAPAG